MKRICVVTGSRAEYGIIKWVLEGIRASSKLALQLVVTGTHLSSEFGLTVREIEEEGHEIDHRVEMLLSSDTSVGVTKSLGLGVIGFADVYENLRPDLVLVLGDRYEIFAAVTAAMVARIPIGHVHGGELTEGLVDDAIRHAITKMSHLHFVATEQYRDRVIQMGELPQRVIRVGGLGVESVLRSKLMSRKQIEERLGFKLLKPTFLVTYHPVTLDPRASVTEFSEILEAFRQFKGSQVIFTMSNADTEHLVIARMIEDFCNSYPNAHFFQSLGQQFYLSLMSHVSAVVGNSSSGLLETPAIGVGTINVGKRQKGRIQAPSVLSVEGNRESIREALEIVVSKGFLADLGRHENPYGDGRASSKIVANLEEIDFSPLLMKTFWNMSHK